MAVVLETYVNAKTLSDPTVPNTVLVGAMDAVTTTIVYLSVANLPTSGQFRVLVNDELMLNTALVGTTGTVTRAVESTVAAAHADGASVFQPLSSAGLTRLPRSMTTAGDIEYLDANGAPARLAIGSNTNVLKVAAGLPSWAAAATGDVVGPSSATDGVPVLFDGTTGKLIKNSVPTGTGVPVLATSPTLVTPVLGVATGTRLTLSPLSGTIGITISNAAASDSVPIYRMSAGSTNLDYYILSTGGAAQLGTTSNHEVDFFANNTVRLGLLTTGGVSIGAFGDVVLNRDKANVLGLRNGASPQGLCLYNTFSTVDTAGEWLETAWASNVCHLGAIKGSSSGTARVLSIDYGGLAAGKTSAISIPITSGNITFGGGITLPGGATFLTTNTALTDGAAAQLGTLATAPTAGNPTKWIGISDNGVTRYIPAW